MKNDLKINQTRSFTILRTKIFHPDKNRIYFLESSIKHEQTIKEKNKIDSNLLFSLLEGREIIPNHSSELKFLYCIESNGPINEVNASYLAKKYIKSYLFGLENYLSMKNWKMNNIPRQITSAAVPLVIEHSLEEKKGDDVEKHFEKQLEKESVPDEDEEEEDSLSAQLEKEDEEELLVKLQTVIMEGEEVKKDQIIPRFEYYTKRDYIIHKHSGLVLTNKDLIKRQRGVAGYLIKRMGKNLLRGASIMGVSLPVTLCEPQTMLQRAAHNFTLAPYFMEKIMKAKDPLEKFKFLLAWNISSIRVDISQEKPFNPILGETFEATIGDAEVCSEQISHHPPISSTLINHKDFRMHCNHEYMAKTSPNSAKGGRKGYTHVELNDEDQTKYKINHPFLILEGTIFGKRSLQIYGKWHAIDEKNNLYALIRMDPERKGFIKSMFSKRKTRSDYFEGYITNDKQYINVKGKPHIPPEKIICKVEGNWIENIKFDGIPYWDLEDVEPLPLVEKPNCLLSDARYRTDSLALRNGNLDESQKEKERLEVIQRNDRKLREPFAKEREKLLKKKLKESKTKKNHS